LCVLPGNIFYPLPVSILQNTILQNTILQNTILQNTFSHIAYLCPQRPCRAEKLEAKVTSFSRQSAFQMLLASFGLKAFRKKLNLPHAAESRLEASFW
jgi:hypothetical protein